MDRSSSTYTELDDLPNAVTSYSTNYYMSKAICSSVALHWLVYSLSPLTPPLSSSSSLSQKEARSFEATTTTQEQQWRLTDHRFLEQ